WVYHCGRWDRLSYFLPYPQRTAAAVRRHYEHGARACMFYQGPVINPGVEVNIAVGGRILADTRLTVADALAEVIALNYRPPTSAARQKLVDVFLRAEDAYFGQWEPARFQAQRRPMPGELHLTDLFGTAPGPALYLLEPFLDAAGRGEYRKGL